MNSMVRACLVLVAFFVTGCAERAGHLIIAGGAINPDNAAVYTSFMSHLPEDAVIGIVPTASGAAQESAASAVKTFSRYAGHRRIEIIDLTTANPERASSPEVAKQISACKGLWFTGGDQSRIVATFRPASGDTPAYAAAMGVLKRGGVIGGSSAGAAMMSDPMITGGTSEDALNGKFRNGSGEAGFGIGKGMGFFPFGITDQHLLKRGRMGRLIVALQRTGNKLGCGIDENSAVDVDLGAKRIRVVSGNVVAVNASGLQQPSGAWIGARVSLLNSGDTIDAASGAIHSTSPLISCAASSTVGPPLPGAWMSGAIAAAFQQIAGANVDFVELRSDAFTLRLSADAATTIRRGDAASPPSVIDVRLDITPTKTP